MWSEVLSDADLGLGTYFLRTNYQLKNEKNLWDIYYTIRRIEETFRCLYLLYLYLSQVNYSK